MRRRGYSYNVDKKSAISVNLPEEIVQELDRIAYNEAVSRSYVLTALIEKYIKDFEENWDGE